MGKKIALIGSAPASVQLAPYRDPSWSIWGCSPGAYPVVASARAYHPGDAYFELHRWEPPVVGVAAQQVPWFSPEYVQWLGLFKGSVWMNELVPEVPNAVRYPIEKMLDKYGPYFFNSSLSFMLALALEEPGIEEIGLWGVDMSAIEEYRDQRPGCHFFITEAMRKGVRVTVPPESDLLLPRPLYGMGESTPMMIKLTARLRELSGRLGGAQQRAEQANREVIFLQGAIDDLKYVIDTWTATDLLAHMAVPAEAPKKDAVIGAVVFSGDGSEVLLFDRAERV